MEEELLAQPQVMKLLDSLREQYTRYQELCRQRNKRTQLDEIHAKVMQVKLVQDITPKSFRLTSLSGPTVVLLSLTS